MFGFVISELSVGIF